MTHDFISEYLWENVHLAEAFALTSRHLDAVSSMVEELVAVRERGGRLFFIGVGGSAANCSHAAADFRTQCGIRAFAMDNMANVTALTNDKGWEEVFESWLRVETLTPSDLVYVMSVGGGSWELSENLVVAMNYASNCGTPIIGVAGRDGGALANMAKACVIVPTVNDIHITPHTESMQAVIWHLLVSHPLLKQQPTAWEGK